MQLTLFSDYSVRLLLYLGLSDDGLVRVEDVVSAYGISRHYMLKVTKELTRLGYVESVRGRRGGVRLIVAPEDVVIGDVVRKTEPPGGVLDCIEDPGADCVIVGVCKLRHVFARAQSAFYEVLDEYTLADLLEEPEPLVSLLSLGPP